jgi:hypothetical protein
MKTVTKSKRHTSHTFHLIMTILTFGLWSLVWAPMTVGNMVIKEKSVTTGPAPYAASPVHGVASPVPSTPRPAIAYPRALAVAAAVLVVMILIVVVL